MLEKVLVCLDGSPLAEEILPHVAGEAGRFGKVILVKVLAPPGVNIPVGIPGETAGRVSTRGNLARFQKNMAEAMPYLESKAQPLRDKGLDVECVVLEGSPGQAIISYAQDNGAGLIALATHGHTGLRQITMGSTAEYLLKHAGLPVLMVTPWKKK